MFQHICSLASAFVLATSAPAAIAQQVVIPPLIKMIVPFGAGSSTDIVARKTATQLAARLGTTVVVENRAGGSTMIGAAAVANAPHDGSMILVTTPSTVSAAAVLKSVAFDLNKDLIPLSILSDGPMLLAASAKSGFKSPADVVAAARANPGTVTYGTSGVGSLPHLSSEMFAAAAQVQLSHIPYKGGAFAIVDLAAGAIDLQLGTYATFAPHIKSGRIVAIGVSSRQTNPAYPGVVSMASAAPGYAGSVWIAAFAQAGTPLPLAQRLNRELNEIATSKEITSVMELDGSAPVAMSLEDLRARIRDEYANWKNIASTRKISLD
jgi:tripartite-type tricarboxylate transporter receptor subunit TctC